MTLQPAPGAGIVQRDAHTIPPREPRDGRRIGTPTSAEEPKLFCQVRAPQRLGGKAQRRGILLYFEEEQRRHRGCSDDRMAG